MGLSPRVRGSRVSTVLVSSASGSIPACAGELINDNYFCRSPRTGLAGSWVMAAACETARFPCGGRVGHECTGSAIARESDVRKDIGGSGGGGRDERADGAHVAARGVAVDGEGAADVADAGGPVRRCVAVGGRATAGGRYRRPAAGADAVRASLWSIRPSTSFNEPPAAPLARVPARRRHREPGKGRVPSAAPPSETIVKSPPGEDDQT